MQPDPAEGVRGQFLNSICVVYARRGKVDRAVEVANRIVNKNQKDRALAEIAEALDRVGRGDEATSIRSSIIDSSSVNLPNLAGVSARQALREGRMDDARKHLERALSFPTSEMNPFDRADTLSAFGRDLFEEGHTNAALEYVHQAIALTTNKLDQAAGDNPWVMLRGIATLQVDAGRIQDAMVTSTFIQVESRRTDADTYILQALIRRDDMTAFEDYSRQMLDRVETSADNGGVLSLLNSTGRLVMELAKNERLDEADSFARLVFTVAKIANSRGSMADVVERSEERLPFHIVGGLIEGGHVILAKERLDGITDPRQREMALKALERAQVEKLDLSEAPAVADTSTPAAAARTTAWAARLAEDGQIDQAAVLANPLSETKRRLIFHAATQKLIEANELSHATESLARYPTGTRGNDWDDGGVSGKLSLLQALAEARLKEPDVAAARKVLRAAADLCIRHKEATRPHEMARVGEAMAEAGDAEGLTSFYEQGHLNSDYSDSIGTGLAKGLGAAEAISIARTQEDSAIQLQLLLGIALELGGGRL